MSIVSAVAFGAIALSICLAAHECGHVCAGLIVGFRFHLYAIGPLLVHRSDTGRIRLSFNRIPSFLGGASATMPTTMHNLRRRFAIVVAGGPLASALLALIAASLLIAFEGLPALARVELMWVRLLSALLFVGTAIPIPNGAFVTDGLRLIRLGLRASADREVSLLTLASLEIAGVRPKEWSADLVDRGVALHDGSIFECQMDFYAYLRAIDTCNGEAAGASIDRVRALLHRVPAGLRGPFLVEMAYFESLWRQRPQAARQDLSLVRPDAAGVRKADFLRARAAIAIAEERFEDARGDLESARVAMDAASPFSSARLEELAQHLQRHALPMMR